MKINIKELLPKAILSLKKMGGTQIPSLFGQALPGSFTTRAFTGIFISFFFLFSLGRAQQTPSLSSSEYVSSLDEDLTLEKVTVLAGKDNVRGIYSVEVDKTIQKFVKDDHHWEYVTSPNTPTPIDPESLVGRPQLVLSFSKTLGADGILTSEVRKDPSGLEILLFLLSAKSGKLISEERVRQVEDNTPAVLKATSQLLSKMKSQLPYDGMILSRMDNRVTLNLGEKDSVQVGDLFPVFKIISGVRHPNRDFLVSTKKAILGQIRIVKVDTYLSFADITSEVDLGSIQKKAKVSGRAPSEPTSTPWTETYATPEVLISEGNQPSGVLRAEEWVPVSPPTFGRVSAQLGLGSFNHNLDLASGQTMPTEVPVYPKIDIEGELWINANWYINALLSQGIAFSRNETGSDPEVLNSTLSQYQLTGGYHFLLGENFFGPKFSLELGVSRFGFFLDRASGNAVASVNYTSLPVGIGGYSPITSDGRWGIGGKVYFHLFPNLSIPDFEGDSSNSIHQLVFYGVRKWSERLRLRMGLEAVVFSSELSGGINPDPPRNVSQRRLLGFFGVDYFF